MKSTFWRNPLLQVKVIKITLILPTRNITRTRKYNGNITRSTFWSNFHNIRVIRIKWVRLKWWGRKCLEIISRDHKLFLFLTLAILIKWFRQILKPSKQWFKYNYFKYTYVCGWTLFSLKKTAIRKTAGQVTRYEYVSKHL